MTDLSSETDQTAASSATARLRKADVWTGVVLAIVAVAMIAEALTFPLQGTYAGVRNAWYVSPALLPLIVGGMLFLLSIGLIAVAARDYRRLAPGSRLVRVSRASISGGDGWLIAVLLAAYIVALVPRVDFVVGTSLFLFVFMAVYLVDGVRGRSVVAGLLIVPAAAALALAIAGAWPAPRTDGQYRSDALFAILLVATIVAALAVARGSARRRLVTAAVTAVGASVGLSAVFKYGLLVPLPREGLGVLLLDSVERAVERLVG